MDPRRNSVSDDGPRYPINAQLGAFDPDRSVYRKARDPSQSFTRRSVGGAPAGNNTGSQQGAAHDRRTSAHEYGHLGPSAEKVGSVSRRRRPSQNVDYFSPNITDPAELPPPPDTGYAPPAAHKGQYVSTSQQPDRRRLASQEYPSRIQTQPNQRGDYSSYNEPEVSPISPNANLGSMSSSTRRRGSVPHRSPLQKLEGKLDDISKEEKRARLEEAEHQAQQRAEAQRLNGITYGYADHESPRQGFNSKGVSTPAGGHSGKARTNPRDIRQSLDGVRRDWQGDVDLQNNQRSSAAPGNQRYYGSQARRREVPLHDTNYAAGTTERAPIDEQKEEDPAVARQNSRANRKIGIVAGGLVGGPGNQESPTTREQNDYPANSGPGGSGRSNSKRLQKKQPETYRTGQRDPNAMSKAHKQMQSDRMGTHSKAAAAAALKHQEHDPVPPADVKNESRQAPPYAVPPQTAAGQHAREQVGLHSGEDQFQPEIMTDEKGHHHFSKILHRHQGPERRYEAPKPLEEWRQAGTARLLGSDIDLEDETSPRDDRNKAWWEQGDSRRRSSYSQSGQYDGPGEDKDDRLSFNPPLFLRCGPLLRYTGMRREQSSRSSRHASGERDIWRGSVMIVTSDAHSSYEKTPALRLFVQPRDLLPPPPAKVDEVSGQHLAPEYVDPLAGLPKLSRSGKLVYVKPVEQLDEEVDLSTIEDDGGLFSNAKQSLANGGNGTKNGQGAPAHRRGSHRRKDGETQGKYREVKAARLHSERGVTFWRFNLEVELGSEQARVAYRINRGPAIGFWVPARGQTMNMMFHSCNGFSLSVDSNTFSGPDPLWRDVLNSHQTRPFHVMIGGGDQIYNDRLTRETVLFQEWLTIKNPEHKHSAQFTVEMQDELENFYLNRYAMWFSQGLFGMANSQIPMINVWDDHDIIDGYGSYPHHTMSTNVFCGLGEVAFKYYMLFQHQTVVSETQADEPSWVLGASPGPYINELSRSVFMFLGRSVAFLGLDCRTERMRDSVLSEESYDLAFDRCRREIIRGETKHLIVLLGVPIAYPRLNFLENVLTSRAMDPIKAIGRTGALGGFVNKFDGGVEILDDLDDHWTAKHHKRERNWFVQELQELAAAKSVRVTILGGDVHLAAVGQFYSNKKLGIPKDHDHRYMPNIISSAIVNTPPPNVMADVLNRRNKIHHLDGDTDEDMIPMFLHDVDGNRRNNTHLLPRRNWCSLREYEPGATPPPTPPPASPSLDEPPRQKRTLSLTRKDFAPAALVRRLSGRNNSRPSSLAPEHARPYSTHTVGSSDTGRRSVGESERSVLTPPAQPQYRPQPQFQRQDTSERLATAKSNARYNENPNPKTASPESIQPQSSTRGPYPPPSLNAYAPALARRHSESGDPSSYGEVAGQPTRPTPFHRRLTDPNIASLRGGPYTQPGHDTEEQNFSDHVNLEYGLDICLNVENSQKDPAGITTPYRLLVPALWYEGPPDENTAKLGKSRIGTVLQRVRHSVSGRGGRRGSIAAEEPDYSDEEPEAHVNPGPRQGQFPRQPVPAPASIPHSPAVPPPQEPRTPSASYGYPHALQPSASTRRPSQPQPQPQTPQTAPTTPQQRVPSQHQQPPAPAVAVPHQSAPQRATAGAAPPPLQAPQPRYDPAAAPVSAFSPQSSTDAKPRGNILTNLARRLSRPVRPKRAGADEGYGRERYGESEEDLPGEDEEGEYDDDEEEYAEGEYEDGEEGEGVSPAGEQGRKRPVWKIWK